MSEFSLILVLQKNKRIRRQTWRRYKLRVFRNLEWVHVGRVVEVQLPVVFIQPVEIAFNAFVPRAQFAILSTDRRHSRL